jgi:alpha-methylacyl-CoA racemase
MSNKLDGGAHYYGSYECSDNKHISIGSIEPQFYALLLERCGITDKVFDEQQDQVRWPILREKLEALFITKPRAYWCNLLEGTDVCFAPVLDLEEAPKHPHNIDRKTYIEKEGITQPAPAPRFSRTQGKIQSAPATCGEHSEEILQNWGFTALEIANLKENQII